MRELKADPKYRAPRSSPPPLPAAWAPVLRVALIVAMVALVAGAAHRVNSIADRISASIIDAASPTHASR